MKTFWKYFLRECFFYTFSFLICFSIIITLIEGIIKLQKYLEFSPSLKDIVYIFILVFLQLFSFVYVLSAFMGILFTIHRLKSEKELLAFYSLGFDLRDFLKPILVFSFFSLIITFVSHFFILPWAKRNLKLIKINLLKAQAEKPFLEKIPIPLGKSQYIYIKKVKKIDKTQKFKNIFLFERGKNKKGFFIAEKGEFISGENLLALIKGWGVFVDIKGNLEVLKFDTYKFRINLKTLKSIYFKRGEKSFFELKKDLQTIKPNTLKYFRYLNEYYQRFLYPFTVLFLIIEAFLLGLYFESSHRFLVFFIGILIFLVFFVLYNFLISLGENGKIYPLWGFFLFYFLISIILVFQYLIFKNKKEIYL